MHRVASYNYFDDIMLRSKVFACYDATNGHRWKGEYLPYTFAHNELILSRFAMMRWNVTGDEIHDDTEWNW